MRHKLPAACFAALLLASGADPAGAQGHGFGGPRPARGRHAGGGRAGTGHTRMAVYEVVAVSSVTDHPGLEHSMAKLGPSLAGTGGRLLVDADQPTAVAGAAPSHLALVVFDDVSSATKWQTSPLFEALSGEFAREGTLQVSAAGGIADPGAPPTVPEASLGAAPGRDRLPEIPKIADICRGC